MTMNQHPAALTNPMQTPQQQNQAPIQNQPAPVQRPTGPAVNTLLGSPLTPQTQDKADLLLTDPNKFAQSITHDVLQVVNEQNQKKQATEKMWDEFYQENADLKDVKWHVESVLGEKLPEWKDIPISEAKQKLAEESRKRIDLLKKKFGVKEEIMHSKEATTLPGSGGSVPQIQQEKQPTSFVEEMMELRRKKRKA